MNAHTTVAGVHLTILSMDHLGAGVGEDLDGNTYRFNLTTRSLTPINSTRTMTTPRLKLNRITMNRTRMGM